MRRAAVSPWRARPVRRLARRSAAALYAYHSPCRKKQLIDMNKRNVSLLHCYLPHNHKQL